MDGEVIDALLTCHGCARWFRIEGGVADVVRDGLREVEQDRAFLRTWESEMPAGLLPSAKPFGIEGPAPVPSHEDQRIIDEGRHWGRFMRRFWDVGDRSIFDVQSKGSHPPFFIAGVIEPDDRDRDRPWGNFPGPTGRMLFSPLHEFAGKLGVDVGCGGGQFGLEAARQRVEMLGFDPSFEELSLARDYARSIGITRIDYIRAEPAHPPFARGIFQLMMSKDALHHVPHLPEVFPRLLELLTPDATLVLHEHYAKGPLKQKILSVLMPRAVRKIRSRYPTVPIPEELLRDSANEDTGSRHIIPLVRRHFDRIASRHDLFLANDLEMMAHFAFGKRRWVSRPILEVGTVLEAILLLLGDRQHISYVGRRKTETRP